MLPRSPSPPPPPSAPALTVPSPAAAPTLPSRSPRHPQVGPSAEGQEVGERLTSVSSSTSAFVGCPHCPQLGVQSPPRHRRPALCALGNTWAPLTGEPVLLPGPGGLGSGPSSAAFQLCVGQVTEALLALASSPVRSWAQELITAGSWGEPSALPVGRESVKEGALAGGLTLDWELAGAVGDTGGKFPGSRGRGSPPELPREGGRPQVRSRERALLQMALVLLARTAGALPGCLKAVGANVLLFVFLAELL